MALLGYKRGCGEGEGAVQSSWILDNENLRGEGFGEVCESACKALCTCELICVKVSLTVNVVCLLTFF